MRLPTIAAALAIGLWFPAAAHAASGASRTTAAAYAGDAAAAAALISSYRASYGLGPVSVDARLNQAAQHQALVLAGSGQLTHGDFATRMARYGVRGQAAENLSGGTYTVADTVALWIRSPGHNANLLLPGVQRIGLGRSSWSFGSSWALILSR